MLLNFESMKRSFTLLISCRFHICMISAIILIISACGKKAVPITLEAPKVSFDDQVELSVDRSVGSWQSHLQVNTITVYGSFKNNSSDTITVINPEYGIKPVQGNNEYYLFDMDSTVVWNLEYEYSWDDSKDDQAKRKSVSFADMPPQTERPPMSNDPDYVLSDNRPPDGMLYLSKYNVSAIPPNGKLKFYIIKKVPNLSSDTLEISSHLEYNTSFLSASIADEKRNAYASRLTELEKKFDKMFSSDEDQKAYRLDCQTKIRKQTADEDCLDMEEYYWRDMVEERYNQQMNFIDQLTPLKLTSNVCTTKERVW